MAVPNLMITPSIGSEISPDPYKLDPGIDNSQPAQPSWWENLLNGLRMYFNFGSGGPAAGNSQGSPHVGTNVPGAGSSPTLDHDTVNGIVEQITGVKPEEDVGGSSAKTSDQVDLSSLLGSSAISSSEGLSFLKQLYEATGDSGYLELIATSMLNRENTASAREWEKMMSDTQYSRAFDDIKNAGYNPWLLLQNGSGTATSSGAGVASSGSSAVSSSRRSSETSTKNVEAQLKSTNMRAGITTAMMLLLALIRFV